MSKGWYLNLNLNLSNSRVRGISLLPWDSKKRSVNIYYKTFSTAGFKANAMFSILLTRQLLGRKQSNKIICSLSAFFCSLCILLNYHSYVGINDMSSFLNFLLVTLSSLSHCTSVLLKSLYKEKVNEKIILYIKQIRLTLFYIQINNFSYWFPWLFVYWHTFASNFYIFHGEKNSKRKLFINIIKYTYLDN